MSGDPTPVVVPPGERADLQKTAQETGERMGSMDTLIAEHSTHLDKINGSIATLAGKMSETATTSAVMAASLTNIERTLDTKVLSHEARLTVIEAWVAERRGSSRVVERTQGRSLQFWLAILGASIAVAGIIVAACVTVAMTLVVLIANGKL